MVLASVLPSWACENYTLGGKGEGGRGHKGETQFLCNVDSFLIVQKERMLRNTK